MLSAYWSNFVSFFPIMMPFIIERGLIAIAIGHYKELWISLPNSSIMDNARQDINFLFQWL